MSAEPALVVEPEHDDGDGGPPPDVDMITLLTRVLSLLAERGPFFQQAIHRCMEQALVESST